MTLVLNTKFFANLGVDELAEMVAELGYDGMDLCVRPGHPVHPQNVRETLPGAVEGWRRAGLVCPMVTAPTTTIDAGDPEVADLYAACADAGVPRVKIGFWKFQEGDDYWQVLTRARHGLEDFLRVGEQHAVQTCYQIHSGRNVGSNCAGLMQLLRGLDPRWAGAYPDLGHLLLDGEDWAMGLAMIRDYLSVVGIKDAGYFPQPEGNVPAIRPRFVNLGTGGVDWQANLRLLPQIGFDGPLSVHTEYQMDEPQIRQVGFADATPPNLQRWAKQDATYLRKILGALD